MKDYILHQSSYITNNIKGILEDIKIGLRLHQEWFPYENTTWTYPKYNTFSLLAPSSHFWYIFQELKNLILTNITENKELWLQSWINYHTHQDLLDWHDHEWPYHGYINLNCEKTETVFESHTVKNKPGQIYFGHGHIKHKVVALENFGYKRITIGFDVHTIPTGKLYRTFNEKPFFNLGFIPLV